MKIKKIKKKKLSYYKKKAWTAVSKYIRERDRYVCFTCGKYGNQAGHMFPKALGNALYFEEANIFCQCYHCNINLGGNGAIFALKFARLYGLEKLEEVKSKIGKTVIYKTWDYEAIEKEYEEKLKNWHNHNSSRANSGNQN